MTDVAAEQATQAGPAADTAAPWSRMKGESGKAHAAFLIFRDLGPERTLGDVANQRRCHISLIRRWSAKWEWASRARAWDEAVNREAEATLRQQRKAAVERRGQDIERLEKLCRAFLNGLVRRDENGQLQLDERVKPRDAVGFYRLALEIERAVAATVEPEQAGDDEDDPTAGMSMGELRQLLDQVRKEIRKEHNDEPEIDSAAAS